MDNDKIVAFFDDVDHQFGCPLSIFHLFGLQTPLVIGRDSVSPKGDKGNFSFHQ
jgi:hypothetical protein